MLLPAKVVDPLTKFVLSIQDSENLIALLLDPSTSYEIFT